MTLVNDAGHQAAEAARQHRSGLRAVVLINEGAGALARGDRDGVRAQLDAAFERYGIAATVEVVNGRNVRDIVRDAVARSDELGIEVVVAGGGDGTIRTVATALCGTAIPLGIIPLGTLNHFAKDAGIPMDIEGAVKMIAARCVHSVDVAEVNGHVFINNSSIGLYPSLVLCRERSGWFGGRPKWIATAAAAVLALKRFPLHRLSIFANGAQEPVRTPCMFVGNNHYGLGPLTLGQRGSLQDGELCLYVAKPQSRIALLWLALRATLGLIERGRDLRTLGATQAEIRSKTSRLFVALDGEVELMRPPLVYRSRPGALRVLGPPPAAS